MVLSLISPNGSNFIKDFPGQHAVNSDRIDDYAGPCLTSHALRTFTPVLGATTTAPTLGGAGTIKAVYYEIFDQIYLWSEFRFASGFNAGSGIYTITLPFNIDTTITYNGTTPGSSPVIGNGIIWDADSTLGRQPIVVIPRTLNTVHFGTKMNNSPGAKTVDSISPITWAAGDGITWSARFKRLPT